jgi:hypothetical protein
MKKVAGAKNVQNKSTASEILPSRMAKATITRGDAFARSGNFYGKSPNDGAKAGPDALIMFTTVGRGFGMA